MTSMHPFSPVVLRTSAASEGSGCCRLLVAELDPEGAAGPRVWLAERTASGQWRGVQEEAVATRARQRSGGPGFDGDVLALFDTQLDLEALDDVVLAAGTAARTLAVVFDLRTVDRNLGLTGRRVGPGQLKPEASLRTRHQPNVL